MIRQQDNRQKYQSGFTLLEVMVAVAILAMALATLYTSLSRSTRSSFHSKMIVQATLLARQKMVEIEELFWARDFQQTGLTEEKEGTFFEGKSIDAEVQMQNNPLTDDTKLKTAFKTFRWHYKIEKLSLTNLAQALGSKAAQAQNGANSLGPVVDSMMSLIQTSLEQQLRKVTLHIKWKEYGKQEEKIEIISFFANTSPGVMSGIPGPAGANPETTGSPPSRSIKGSTSSSPTGQTK